MQIIVNEQQRHVQAEFSVTDIVQADFGCSPQGVAVAVNDEVIPRSQWSSHHVAENDRVLIVQAVQGG